MFKLKDNVIYPGHGVAIVDEIIERNVGTTTITFFKLTFLFKEMTILVPLYNIEGIGLRYQSDPEVIDAVLLELYKKPERKLDGIDFTPSGWNRRHKEYQLRIQGGRLVDLAKIYRDVMYVARQKELSFGERTLLQSVEDLMAQEVQIVKEIDREMAVQLMRTPFKQLSFYGEFFQEVAPSAT